MQVAKFQLVDLASALPKVEGCPPTFQLIYSDVIIPREITNCALEADRGGNNTASR